jgi:hypothetical protein
MTSPAPGTPGTLPPTGPSPAFQGPVPAQVPVAPTTGAVSYPTGIQAAGYYPGYAQMPWMQPPNYPAYWNMPNGR